MTKSNSREMYPNLALHDHDSTSFMSFNSRFSPVESRQEYEKLSIWMLVFEEKLRQIWPRNMKFDGLARFNFAHAEFPS